MEGAGFAPGGRPERFPVLILFYSMRKRTFQDFRHFFACCHGILVYTCIRNVYKEHMYPSPAG